MNKLLLALSILFTGFTAISQTKTKEKAPTQNEVQDMMKELQKSMDEISPEDKKAMEDMGYKVPSTTIIPNLTDEQLQAGVDELSRIVPKKDLARIASIPKTHLTKSSLPAYLAATDAKVLLQLKPQSKVKGDEIYKLIKAEHNSAAETGNAAASLWMMGRVELAICVMGKACIDDPSNTNNLNNYASMLSMAGAEHLSIPILENINKSSPKNSTILNNIGQAWFGLGDITKSENYLDSTIRIYAYHPQANFTKSFIEENKGNTEAAVQAAKRSIKSGYTNEKETRLYKLGYDLDSKDIYWDKPLPQDPLGLEKFHWPAFPKSVSSSIQLEKEWKAFSEACAKEDDILESQQAKLEDASTTIGEARQQQLIKASRTGQGGSLFPPLAYKAFKKLKYLVDDNDGQLIFSMDKKIKAKMAAIDEVENLSQTLSEKYKTLDERYQPQFGEGKANPFDAACNDYNSAADGFLSSANTLLEQTQKDYLDDLRRYLNNQIYYDQYTKWPEQFELAKVIAKRKWLGAINQKVMFKSQSYYCQKKEEIKPGKGKLQDFDDVACVYHSELKLPIGNIKVDCSRVTSELDLKVIKLGLKQNMEKETFGDQFMSCSVEVGAGSSVGVNSGVIKAEVGIGGSIRAEFDRTGLTDVVIKTEAGVSLGTNIIDGGSMAGAGVNDLSVEVGVKGQISLVSGKSSVESTGLLNGVFKK
jgi:hypothetical protein